MPHPIHSLTLLLVLSCTRMCAYMTRAGTPPANQFTLVLIFTLAPVWKKTHPRLSFHCSCRELFILFRSNITRWNVEGLTVLVIFLTSCNFFITVERSFLAFSILFPSLYFIAAVIISNTTPDCVL